MRSLLLALPLLAIAPAADAKCAMMGLTPTVLAGAGDTAIAAGGGIVVAATPSMDRSLEKGDAAAQPTWRFRVRRALVPATIEAIAAFESGINRAAFPATGSNPLIERPVSNR